MLVLSRRSGEGLWIGQHIRVCLLEIKGNRVRLGIEAPDDVRVLRDELCFWQEEKGSADGGSSGVSSEAMCSFRADRSPALNTPKTPK